MGQDSTDVAISTKINLQAQTDKTMKITQSVTDMRNQDVRQGGKLLSDIEHVRRKNLCILYVIGGLLFSALMYIIWSKYNKHFGS